MYIHALDGACQPLVAKVTKISVGQCRPADLPVSTRDTGNLLLEHSPARNCWWGGFRARKIRLQRELTNHDRNNSGCARVRFPGGPRWIHHGTVSYSQLLPPPHRPA